MRITSFFLCLCIALPLCIWATPPDREILFYEDFKDINDWRPFFFPKKKPHTHYSVVHEGDRTYLKAESNASASALIHTREFDVHEYPGLRWKWRVENVYLTGDVQSKSGDDYPMRVYVLFKYDPEKATLGQKIKYGIARKIHRQYPPHSSLNYIWANRKDEKGIFTNPYADESKMVIVESGRDKVGQWIEEDVNIVDDYRKAFGKDPPVVASIAVMNDSDNTGERSVSYIEFIEVYKVTKSAEERGKQK